MKMCKVSFDCLVLWLGFLIFVLGVVSYLSNGQRNVPTDISQYLFSSLAERNQAVNVAKAKRLNTYHFETNFIPGIGRVGNPEAYRDQQLANLKRLAEDFDKLNLEELKP